MAACQQSSINQHQSLDAHHQTLFTPNQSLVAQYQSLDD
jgi:hypothetical protein